MAPESQWLYQKCPWLYQKASGSIRNVSGCIRKSVVVLERPMVMSEGSMIISEKPTVILERPVVIMKGHWLYWKNQQQLSGSATRCHGVATSIATDVRLAVHEHMQLHSMSVLWIYLIPK